MSYTEEELSLLTLLPSEIGSAVAFSGKSGVVGTVKEMMANSKTALGGAKEYPDNSIIQSVLPNLEDREEAMAQAKEMRAAQMEKLKAAGIKNKEDMIAHAVSNAGKVSAILATNGDAAEVAEYKEWVLSIGTAVANAAKEGGFLGIGGEVVSEDEEQVLAQISAALS